MKKMFVLFCLVFSFSLNATSILGKKLEVKDLAELEDIASRLPELSKVKIETVKGPQYAAVQPNVYAAVQPTVWLRFDYASCAPDSFQLKSHESKHLVFVAVDHSAEGADCPGPVVSRSYSIQLASDNVFKKITVLNPVGSPPSLSNVQLPYGRMCTANTGTLYHPQLKRYATYTDGCIKAELESQGYTTP